MSDDTKEEDVNEEPVLTESGIRLFFSELKNNNKRDIMIRDFPESI